MDTRSSSGSGSHSTNPTNPTNPPHSGPVTSQQATYTTAGTVYNPQTAPPLQPPARRGRAARWPPAATADLSAFNSSIAGGAFPRSRYRSPPTTASTLKHYTPLQQNQDRAVDPTQRTPTSLSNPKRTASGDSATMSFSYALPHQLLADEPRKVIICDDCGEHFRTSDASHFHTRVRGHESFSECDVSSEANEDSNQPEGDELMRADDEKEEEDLARFNNLSVKTLTSLASYPNPNQKTAQKCLDRARETFRPTNETSRPSSRNSSRLGFDGAGTSAASHFGGVGARDSSAHYSRVPRNNMYTTSSTRSSVLSNGPGAPQPLTAGPPGQRQYKASTFEGPLRALQESAQNPFSSEGPEPVSWTNAPSRPGLASSGRQPSLKMPEPFRAVQFSNLDGGDAPRATSVKETSRWASGIRETRTQDEISDFYKGGLVWDFNAAGLVPTPRDNSDLQPSPRFQQPIS